MPHGIGSETPKINHGQLSSSILEPQIDAMFERLDTHYNEIMNEKIDEMHREQRLHEIQTRLGELSIVLKESYTEWEALVYERIQLNK